jgi:hypothetical protein
MLCYLRAYGTLRAMTTLTVWLLVMTQGNVLQFVSTYMKQEECYAAQARAPATVLAYCLEAKTSLPAKP